MTIKELNEMTPAEIEARIKELDAEVESISAGDATEEAIGEIEARADEKKMLMARKNELDEMEERKADASEVAHGAGVITEVSEKMNVIEERAKTLKETGRMEIRQLLAAGTLTPTAVKQEIGELPEVMSSIVDDVNAFSLDGRAGAWAYAYRNEDGKAAKVTDGAKIEGTAGSFEKGEITPETWGILDEISNQVKWFTPLQYEASIRNNSYLALRRYAKRKITETIVSSEMADKNITIAIDEKFLRALVLGFNADESVGGGAKLYLTKSTLAKIGAIRGEQEKKPVFEIEFSDENNGTIKDGGLSVNFSILSDLGDKTITGLESAEDAMIYGQMKSVDMPLWGNYTIETDEGGGYFARNMMGIRGLQAAGVGIVRKHTVQVINVNP